jgi:hypothetical protein
MVKLWSEDPRGAKTQSEHASLVCLFNRKNDEFCKYYLVRGRYGIEAVLDPKVILE